MKRSPTSLRLSEEGKRIRKELSEQLGIDQTAIIELALRELAKKHLDKKEKQK